MRPLSSDGLRSRAGVVLTKRHLSRRQSTPPSICNFHCYISLWPLTPLARHSAGASTTSVPVAVRPFISGRYIISAWTDGCRKVPGVVARAKIVLSARWSTPPSGPPPHRRNESVRMPTSVPSRMHCRHTHWSIREHFVVDVQVLDVRVA